MLTQLISHDNLRVNLKRYALSALFQRVLPSKKEPGLLHPDEIDTFIPIEHSDKAIRLEISDDKIRSLLARRLICAADLHCLDRASKTKVKQLCLQTCLGNYTSA